MDFKIYLIGEKNLFDSEEEYLDALEICFASGIKAFQLRQKDIGVKDFIKLGEKIKGIAEKYGDIKLFVNDRVDVAVALDAYGVHLNKNSVPISAVKRKKEGLKVFYSSHSAEEAVMAENEGADAVTVSPVFETKNYGHSLGMDELKKTAESVNIPVFALGGIKHTNVLEVIKTGVRHVAVQSGLLKASDIGTAVKVFADLL